MGTICAHPMEKDQCNETVDTAKKNFVQIQANLGNTIFVDLVLGQYRYQRCQSLLIIIEGKYIHHCDSLKEYVSDIGRTIDTIQNMRKSFFKPVLNRSCPFKKLLICILPHYHSEEAVDYKQLYCNVIRQAFEGVKEATVEFSNTMEGVNTLPNQMLIDLLLHQLTQMQGGFKLSMVTAEKKMMNLYKYQLLKNEQFRITENKQ